MKQNISFFETGSSGRLDITVGPKQTMGKTVECLVVTVHMPKVVLSANLNATQGTYNYDPVTKVRCNSLSSVFIDLLYWWYYSNVTAVDHLKLYFSFGCCLVDFGVGHRET